MKSKIILFMLFFIPCLLFSQNNDKDKGKSFYTNEEIRQMCGLKVDLNEMPKILAKQDSMYKDYLDSLKTKKLGKTATIPDWRTMDVSGKAGCVCGDSNSICDLRNKYHVKK